MPNKWKDTTCQERFEVFKAVSQERKVECSWNAVNWYICRRSPYFNRNAYYRVKEVEYKRDQELTSPYGDNNHPLT